MDIEKELSREASFASYIEEALAKNAGKIHAAGIKVFALQKATAKDDMENGFDFVFTMGNFTVPVRIRKPDCKYRDFTIRTQSRGGGRTEINKLIDGAGDVYFYAWTAIVNTVETIVEYWIIDLHKMRRMGLFNLNRKSTSNGDGTAFVSIKKHELEFFNCIIAQS